MKINFLRIICHILCLLGLGFVAILPKNKYEWMRQMDPGLTTLPTDDGASQRLILVSLILLGIVVMQLVLSIKAKTKTSRWFCLLIIGISVAVWWIRWL